MGLFRRGQAEPSDDMASGRADSDSDASDDRGAGTDSLRAADGLARNASDSRAIGPWDSAEEFPERVRADVGALLVPQSSSVKLQVQADPSTGVISQLTLVSDNSAVQVQPYAAPRSGGMWDDVRSQLKGSANSAGGVVEETDGALGRELRAQVSNQDGKSQPARFCGIDGPRWFVRFVFLGKAARDDRAMEPLLDLIRDIVVVRGTEALPVGRPLPLRVPEMVETSGQDAQPDSAQQRRTITLPARGPEITETR